MDQNTSSGQTSSTEPAVRATDSKGPRFDSQAPLARKHLQLGWWSLLVFLLLGVALESFHAFKLPYYVNADNKTRRLMFTLSHAHGTALSLVNIGFGCTLLALLPAGNWKLVSRCLILATTLVPAGFLLGGLVTHEGDPGIGILLVPIGALLLFVAVFRTARNLSKSASKA